MSFSPIDSDKLAASVQRDYLDAAAYHRLRKQAAMVDEPKKEGTNSHLWMHRISLRFAHLASTFRLGRQA